MSRASAIAAESGTQSLRMRKPPRRSRLVPVHQVRFHGRGGQGVVTAAELLAAAAFLEGRHAQAFPSFGSERTGAPVVAFCRVDDHAIRTREPISRPDALVIQDPTLLQQVAVFDGLTDDGHVLVNSTHGIGELGLSDLAGRLPPDRVLTLPATELAREHVKRPLPNAALLGGLAAMTRIVSVDSVAAAIGDRFPGPVGDANTAAARAASEFVERERALADA